MNLKSLDIHRLWPRAYNGPDPEPDDEFEPESNPAPSDNPFGEPIGTPARAPTSVPAKAQEASLADIRVGTA